MTPDPSISDRLAEIAAALRSPLSRDLSGEMTTLGDQRADGLTAMLGELPQIKAETPDDALALAVIAGAMLQSWRPTPKGTTSPMKRPSPSPRRSKA